MDLLLDTGPSKFVLVLMIFQTNMKYDECSTLPMATLGDCRQTFCKHDEGFVFVCRYRWLYTVLLTRQVVSHFYTDHNCMMMVVILCALAWIIMLKYWKSYRIIKKLSVLKQCFIQTKAIILIDSLRLQQNIHRKFVLGWWFPKQN